MWNSSSFKEKRGQSINIWQKQYLYVKSEPKFQFCRPYYGYYGADRVDRCYNPFSQFIWGHSQSESTGAQQTSGKEVRLWGKCYSLLDHARSSLFLLLLASIPLTRARTKPSARVRFMNKSEVSHFKCGPRFPCWQWALKQASVTSNFSPTAMIPNLHPAHSEN